jgi:hypothetical protein
MKLTRKHRSTTRVGPAARRGTPAPTPHSPTAPTTCGHARNLGTCPNCQQAALREQGRHLAAAIDAREAWARRSNDAPASSGRSQGGV